jgi:ABC-type Co2+ transport system, periplasmic component
MNRLLGIASLVLGTLAFSHAHAHRSWVLPSATVLSAPGDWVTVDAAVSNELFYFNHVPLRLDSLKIAGPTGAPIAPQNMSTGKFRSTFDAQLSEAGTYRIAIVNDGVMATYKDKGEQKRWRGRAEDFAKQVPASAQELKVFETIGRVETFVTAGKPSEIAAVGSGLELVPVTHPNDLFAQEPARFKFLVDGKPGSDLEVTIVPGGSRYRDQPNELKVKTDAQGQFEVTWPEAGMYWINATTQDKNTRLEQASERRLSYTATLEVLAP